LARVRPYLASHGGDVELLGIDEPSGVVRLHMIGSCDGCPSSALTLKLAVESAILALAPEISHIEVDGAAPRSAAAVESGWVVLDRGADPERGRLDVREVAGARLVLCRVD